MRKSNKCSYKIGINERKKRKFLRPEEAMNEANRLNKQPNLLKKFIAYKCTVCCFFHVGRSNEDLKRESDIFTQVHEEVIVEDLSIIEEEAQIIETSIEEEAVIEEVVIEDIQVTNSHDDFDWDTDHRII